MNERSCLDGKIAGNHIREDPPPGPLRGTARRNLLNLLFPVRHRSGQECLVGTLVVHREVSIFNRDCAITTRKTMRFSALQ